MQIGGAARMSIGIMSQGDVIIERSFGFADVDQGLVSNSSTIYPLASLTKAFIAATIAQLVDEGVLDWNEPLKSYIPEISFHFDPLLAFRLTLKTRCLVAWLKQSSHHTKELHCYRLQPSDAHFLASVDMALQ